MTKFLKYKYDIYTTSLLLDEMSHIYRG